MSRPIHAKVEGGVSPGCVYVHRRDRLGARLIALFNGFRIAREFGVPFRLRWESETDVAGSVYPPEQLFAESFLEACLVDDAEWSVARTKCDVIFYGALLDRTTMLERLRAGRSLLVNALEPVGILDEPSDKALRDIARLWDEFPFHPDLQRARRDLKGIIPAETTAYHVRRGDLLHDARNRQKPWPGKYVVDEFFDAHMSLTRSAGGSLCLFSDDPATRTGFAARHAPLLNGADLVPNEGLTGAQHDFLELCAMSLCREVVAPSFSAFSVAAALFGAARRTEVPTTLPPAILQAASEAAATRLMRDSPDVKRPVNGQDLYWLTQFLCKEGRQVEAANLLERRLREGLDISYLYPLATALWIVGGSFDRAEEMGRFALDRVPLERGDLGAVAAMLAVALARRGATDAARDAFEPALWALPDVPAMQTVFAALQASGAFGDDEMFRVDGEALPRVLLRPEFDVPVQAAIDSLGAGTELTIDATFFLDWSVLLDPRNRLDKPRLLSGSLYSADFRQELARVAAFDGPARKRAGSALGLLRAKDGDHSALEDLAALAATESSDPLLHHRRSVAARLLSDNALALEAADAAVALSPAGAGYRAWRGTLRVETGDHAGGAADLRDATQAGLRFPGLWLRLARSLHALGDRSGAAEARGRARSLAPWSAPAALPAIHDAVKARDLDAARDALRPLLRAEPGNPQVAELAGICSLDPAPL